MSELEKLLERLIYFRIKWEFTDHELCELIGISKFTVKRLNDNMYRFKRKDQLLSIHSPTMEKLRKFIASEELLEKKENVAKKGKDK